MTNKPEFPFKEKQWLKYGCCMGGWVLRISDVLKWHQYRCSKAVEEQGRPRLRNEAELGAHRDRDKGQGTRETTCGGKTSMGRGEDTGPAAVMLARLLQACPALRHAHNRCPGPGRSCRQAGAACLAFWRSRAWRRLLTRWLGMKVVASSGGTGTGASAAPVLAPARCARSRVGQHHQTGAACACPASQSLCARGAPAA